MHGTPHRIELAGRDVLFVTLGSMVEGSSRGGMHRAASPKPGSPQGAWALWERIAARDRAFGRPQMFCGHVGQSKWMSFTVTLRTSAFFDHMERFTGNKAGTGGLVTLTDSNWFMSVVLAHQPHFPAQPEDVFVFWGDGLSPDAVGNFVNKPMASCTGEEILIELFLHLGILDEMRPLMRQMNCVPCMMPYIDCEFMPRGPGDRPAVMPPGRAISPSSASSSNSTTIASSRSNTRCARHRPRVLPPGTGARRVPRLSWITRHSRLGRRTLGAQALAPDEANRHACSTDRHGRHALFSMRRGKGPPRPTDARRDSQAKSAAHR